MGVCTSNMSETRGPQESSPTKKSSKKSKKQKRGRDGKKKSKSNKRRASEKEVSKKESKKESKKGSKQSSKKSSKRTSQSQADSSTTSGGPSGLSVSKPLSASNLSKSEIDGLSDMNVNTPSPAPPVKTRHVKITRVKTTPVPACQDHNSYSVSSQRVTEKTETEEKKQKDKESTTKQKQDKYSKAVAKLLASKGKLAIPDDLKWFPSGHGHKKAKKLFDWKREIGHGVTGVVYAAYFKGRMCAVKKIEV